MQEADDAGHVVGGRPDDGHPVSALEVGLDHLIVLAITESEGFDVRALQPGIENILILYETLFLYHYLVGNGGCKIVKLDLTIL